VFIGFLNLILNLTLTLILILIFFPNPNPNPKGLKIVFKLPLKRDSYDGRHWHRIRRYSRSAGCTSQDGVIDDESLVKTLTNTCFSYTSAVPSYSVTLASFVHSG
jgi:hypothetical protein